MVDKNSAEGHLAALPKGVRKALWVFISVSSRQVPTPEELETRLQVSAALHRGDTLRRPA